MFQLKHISIKHNYDDRTLIEEMNLHLHDGDKAVIIGEEGNGKSTLLKWIYDEKLVSDYASVTGEKIVTGEVLAYLPQELEDENKELEVYNYLLSQEAYIESPEHLLRKHLNYLGLKEELLDSSQQMESLSGGERLKIQLLSILLQNPTVLLLDEPTNDLDMDTLAFLEMFLNDYEGKLLFISHDETLIEKVATMVIHLEQLEGKKSCRVSVNHMDFLTYANERDLNFRKQERKAYTELREKRIRDEKLKRIEQQVHVAQATISRGDPAGGRLLKKKMKTLKSQEKRFSKEDENMTKRPATEEPIFFKLGHETTPLPSKKRVLEVFLPELKAPDGRILSRDISLSLFGNEKIAILGDNGVGKSTLLKLLYEDLKERKDLVVKYMPQNYYELLEASMSPIEYLNPVRDKQRESLIRTYLGSLRFTHHEMDQPMKHLSGGQKGKVLLLELSLSGANVLLLDEPTRNFSPLSGNFIRKIFKEFPGAILAISHDRKLLNEVFDEFYELTPSGFIKL